MLHIAPMGRATSVPTPRRRPAVAAPESAHLPRLSNILEHTKGAPSSGQDVAARSDTNGQDPNPVAGARKEAALARSGGYPAGVIDIGSDVGTVRPGSACGAASTSTPRVRSTTAVP